MINPYSVIIINIDTVFHYFNLEITSIKSEYFINDDDIEFLYDWLVCEALSKIFKHIYKANLIYHYRHDVYRCVYSHHGHVLEKMILNKLQYHNLGFITNHPVKAMVVRDTIVLGKGVY